MCSPYTPLDALRDPWAAFGKSRHCDLSGHFQLKKELHNLPERGSPSSWVSPRGEAASILTGCQFFNAKLKEKFAATTRRNLKKINHSYLQPADSSLSHCNHQAPRERLLLSY